MDKIILNGYGGGLGDWLQYSTIPELAYKNGVDCYIYSNAPFRNEQTLNLLLKNPYLKGLTDELPNGGSMLYRTWDPELNNIIKIQEYNHGFHPLNIKPIIYYQPKLLKNFLNKEIVDFNSISTDGLYNQEKIQNYLDGLSSDTILLNNKNYKLNGKINYFTKDIFGYCDVIYSCKKFICLHSGGSTLTSAISRFRADLENIVFIPEEFDIVKDIASHVFIFDGQQYKKF
jgi:hypothetical protein